MALDANATKLANLVNPQVIADMFDKKLVDNIRLAPLFDVDATLAGRAGDEVTLPAYQYIGDAEDVAEGVDIDIAKLSQVTTKVKVKKAGKGVQITDEAVLSGYGDPVNEAVSQLILSVSSKLENDCYASLATVGAQMRYTKQSTEKFPDTVQNALELFGEDVEGEKVLLCAPSQRKDLMKATDWLPASEIAANIIVKGTIGEIAGCQTVTVNRLKNALPVATFAKTEDKTITASKTYYEVDGFGKFVPVEIPVVANIANYYERTVANKHVAFIVKPGAGKIYTKRDTMVESDRDIINKSTVMTVDKHYVTYLYNESKVIMIILD